eukprot:9487654-Pyramimonas_sp.AAC.1
MVCFTLPPGSAAVLRSLPGFGSYDESKHCFQCLKPGTGAKDAPRAFSLKLRRVTRGMGLQGTSRDEEFEMSPNLLAAKHVDDIDVTGTDAGVDSYVKCVESTFGACKLNKHTYTSCAVRYSKSSDGDVSMDQDDYIKQLRPIHHVDLAGSVSEEKASKPVAD